MAFQLVSKEFKKQSKSDKAFDIINHIFLFLILIIVLYPLWFIIIASFSSPNEVAAGNVLLWPKGFNVRGYAEIFKFEKIWIGYKNSIIYTILGTSINLIATIPAAFAFSRREMVGSKFLMFLFTFTMFFGGGLIPTYLLIQDLGLYDTVWALVLPGAVSVYNLIVARTFFDQSIPNELWEAANVDGCDYIKYFFQIVLPISKPIIAVMLLIYAVGHWNSYFSALIYIIDAAKQPLQVILREILIQSQNVANMGSASMETLEAQRQLSEMIKYGVIIVSSLPVLIIYPFVQKHFVKGMMIGAVKG
ncbi:MAG TPA: carbohydrate ABC transporter permease [Candidatus Ruthenibacterium merdavium]|uniref:Carbohydrate ABC transporter permease n=1 Tax=Candidatus Ruthenibacterium merdavium TaxID=2838752 RepID=A0A9D2Q3F9_9FIRM|nr:carbohydrate ABC transporter permease [Candidatus Ruthenibacterium merdavium]